jgi:hypothetical protein
MEVAPGKDYGVLEMGVSFCCDGELGDKGAYGVQSM